MIASLTHSWCHRARQIAADRSGLAMLEFAFVAPLLLAMGLYGAETANLALINMRVSQIALSLADNASRVGNAVGTNEDLREVDMNDVLQAARKQGQTINLTKNGRITISSLEYIQQSYDAAPVQRIHWQRCLGLRSGLGYSSSYTAGPNSSGASGKVPAEPAATTAGTDASQSNAGSLAPNGMGDTGALISSPANSGVVFVEVNYNYKPLIANYLLGTTKRVHYIASYIVRDHRDFSQLFNPAPAATAATCNLYTT